MRPATIVGGAIGGLLVAALLAPSLYLDIPRSLMTDWTTAPRSAGLLTTLLAGVAMVLTGMAGAAGSPDRQARAGAMAGSLAALVALLVMLPGTAVLAHGPLIELVEGGRATTGDLKRAIVTSVVRTPGFQTLGASILLSGGAMLGWLGGVIHDLWRGQPSRVVPAIRPAPTAWIGLLALTVAIPMQLGATVAIEAFVFDELGATATWTGQAQLTAPLALGGTIAAVLVSLIARDAVLVFRKGQRVRAVVWLLGMAALLAVLAVSSVASYWQVVMMPGGILGTLAVGISPIVGLILGWRSQMEVETDPRIFQDVVGEGLFAGMLVGAIFVLHGLSSSASMYWLSMPYREELLSGASKVSTVSLAESVHQLYLAHLSVPVVMFVLAMGYLLLAVPVWFVSRLVKG